jgi:hypothetical protein
MANVRQDNVQIKLEIDGSQSRTELDNLTRKAQVLQDGLKGLKKGSEEYVAQSAELSQVRVRMGELQDEIGITGLSYAQLGNLSRQLGKELNNLVPATEAYVAKATELGKVQARMDELRTGIKEVAEAFRKSADEVTDFAKVRDEVGLLGLTMEQLGSLTSQLNKEVAELTPGTEAFVAKAAELQQAQERLDEVRQQARGIGEEVEESGNKVLDFIKKAVGFAGIQLGVEAVVDSLRELGTESINAAVKGSDSISDMEKSLNVTTAEAKGLRDELENIDTRTSQENLEGMAIAAGQLGIAKDQAVAFTQSVDQANVALGDEFTGGVEEITKSLGGLQKLFKETANVSPADAITKIGSAINALGADGQATGPVIADFTARIGQLGNLAPQITQTLGLGAAFQELGLSAEISSGGLSNVLLTAAKDTAGFGKQIGLTSKQFEDLINSDPNEVILRLADSFKGASETQIISTLDGLGIKSQEATKVMSLLASQTDFVRAKQKLANDEYTKGTSLLDEFAKKNTNAAAEVEKAEKTFTQYRQELGERLLPIYLQVLHYTTMVVDVMRALPGFVSENRVAFGLLALAITAYNAEQIRTQTLLLKDIALRKLVALGILEMTVAEEEGAVATYSLASAQEALDAALLANPIGIIIGLLALFAFGLKQLYDRSETFRGAVDSLMDVLRPLGSMLGSLVAQVAPLATQIGKFFSSISGGKGILEFFGYLMGVAVVLPLKLVITQVQLAVDQFDVFLNAGKRVANFFGADFKVDNGSFDRLTKNLKANGQSMLDTLNGQDAARAAAEKAATEKRNFDALKELEHRTSLQLEAEARRRQQEQKAAAGRKADNAKNSLEDLKAREANIRAALALVESGSVEELRLKKLLVTTKRDIDLLGEKKTEGDKKVIVAEALRDLRQLQDEYDKKTREAAEKRAKEQAEVEKRIADLKAGLLADETERRIQQLTAAAEKEKATAKGTAAQIAEQRQLIEQKLEADIKEVRRQAVQKEALDALDIEKQRNALIKNEWERRAAELRTAAASETQKILDTDKNAAEKRRLVQEKLQQDLVQLERDRVAQQQEIAARIVAIDEDIALRRIQRKKQQAGLFGKEGEEAAQAEEDLKKKQLGEQLELDLANENLTINEKLALIRKYHADVKVIEQEHKDWSDMNNKERFAYIADLASQSIQTLADLGKIGTDKDLAQVDKTKKARLANLEAEYKAGVISKEKYETNKAGIEAEFDEKARAIKKQAAEKEKAYNIAQAVIQTALSIVKASPNAALMFAAGVTGAASIAKIVATPIPEFEDGGVFGGAKPGLASRISRAAGQAWRGVKQFATGGRINPTAGVADVGQRHSGGGIKMVDGATGQHLGEWERGEAYMILSRDTYANNKHLVDELIDTSLHRGGAPVRRQDDYYEDGGTFGGSPATSSTTAAGNGGQELVQAVIRVETAIKALPAWVRIHWDQEDDAMLEQRLGDRADDRAAGEVR